MKRDDQVAVADLRSVKNRSPRASPVFMLIGAAPNEAGFTWKTVRLRALLLR